MRLAGAALAIGASLAPAAAYAGRAGGGVEVPFVRLVLGLALCTIVAIGAALMLRRAMQGGFRLSALRLAALPRDGIVVHETRKISLHGDACRLAWNGREYLVVVSNGGVVLVGEKPIETPSTGDGL